MKEKFYMNKIKELIKLMCSFCIMGIQMFGNLVTMIPVFEKELVEKRNLISKDDILDSITIGKCGPGAAIINTVAFLGNKICGFLGGVFATIGFISFPFIIIILIAFSMDTFMNNQYVQCFLRGVSTCISIMIIKSMIDFIKITLVNKINIIVFIITFILEMYTDISTIVFVILFGVSAFFVEKYKNSIDKKTKKNTK